MTVRNYDLTGWNDDKIEQGDFAEPGWHHAKVTGIDENFQNNTLFLEYTILGGPSAGRKITDRIQDMDEPGLSDQARAMRFRFQILRAKRFGLLPSDDQRGPSFSINWTDAVGKEVFLKVQKRSYNKPDGTPASVTETAFDGVYPPEDDRIPEPARRHEPCGLDVLSEADQKRKADKEAAKEQKAADKAAKGANGGSGRKRATTPAASAPSAAQMDFGDI